MWISPLRVCCSSLTYLFQWLGLVIRKRLPDNEDLRTLTSINDIRNGFLGHSSVHDAFDRQRIAILKVCFEISLVLSS
jgi:hypothetical protein